MDPINNTLSQLMEMFNKRMSEFEAQLQKAPTGSTSSTDLASDFANFKVFITQALGSLQQQVELLSRSIDSMEMRGRRRMLLLHGISEAKDDDIAQVVANVIKDRMQVSGFTVGDIKRCHRMGRTTASNRTRPILFKLHDMSVRNKIWFDKTKLKGSGITISEFLTKSRHDLFMAARQKLGVTRCWTRDGFVYVLRADGTRHRVVSFSELNALEQQDSVGSVKTAALEKPTNAITRSKRGERAVANKK